MCLIVLSCVLAVIDVFLLEYFYQCMFFITDCLVAVVFLAASAHKVKASRNFTVVCRSTLVHSSTVSVVMLCVSELRGLTVLLLFQFKEQLAPPT